jgi:hypothetical protein
MQPIATPHILEMCGCEGSPIGEVNFLIFNFLKFAIDWKNNSKTKVEKVFFLIFMSSYAEMSFLKEKLSLKRVQTFFLK